MQKSLHFFLFTFKIIHAKFMSMQQKLNCWPQSNAMDRLMPILASSILQKKNKKSDLSGVIQEQEYSFIL